MKILTLIIVWLVLMAWFWSMYYFTVLPEGRAQLDAWFKEPGARGERDYNLTRGRDFNKVGLGAISPPSSDFNSG